MSYTPLDDHRAQLSVYTLGVATKQAPSWQSLESRNPD